MAVEVAEEEFSAALAHIVAVFRELVADAVAAEFAEFRAGLAALLANVPAEPPGAPVEPAEPVEPVEPAAPADEPSEPADEPAAPAAPAAPVGDGVEVVRREGAEGFDAFEGEPGVREVFVLTASDEVKGFVQGEDVLEVSAATVGGSGEALTDFDTATANRDLRAGELANDDEGEPVALLFTAGGVNVVASAVPLSGADWVFAA